MSGQFSAAKTADPLAKDRAFLVHSLHNRAAQENARIWTRGRGAVIYDQEGKEHLDALAEEVIPNL